LTVRVPFVLAVLPGLTIVPAAIVNAPTVPAPARVPPFNATAELPIAPLTSSVPALTVVFTPYVLVPARTSVPLPSLVTLFPTATVMGSLMEMSPSP